MSKPPAGPAPLNLVNSSRLQALRSKTSDPVTEANNEQVHPQADSGNIEEQRLRTLVGQRLSEILADFPAGKQRSLFKIRFGHTVDEVEQMPSHQAAALLKSKAGKPKRSRYFMAQS
jgi:hypothetical protein